MGCAALALVAAGTEAWGQAAPPNIAAAAAKAPEIPSGSIEMTDAVLGANAALTPAPVISSDAFAARPDFSGPRLSPLGTRFAARQTVLGEEYLCVYTMDGSKPVRLFGLPAQMDVINYFWVGNDKVLVDLAKTVPWFDGDARQTRLVAIDLVTGKMQTLGNAKQMGLKGDDVLWSDPAGKTILLAYQGTIYDYPGVFRIDLDTNKATRVVAPMTDIWDWYADTSGVVRYGYGWPDDHHWQMVYRKDAAQKFAVVAKGSDKDDDDKAVFDRDRAFNISAGTDEGYVFGVGTQSGVTGIYRYNFATHTMGDLVFEAAGVDIVEATTSEDGKSMFSAFYTDSRDRRKWFDPALAELQAGFDKAVNGALGEREVWIASRSRDNEMMIVQVLASNDPGRYYVYQAASGKLTPLTKPRDQLKPSSLAVSRYVHYTARDGTEIPAYVTLPRGRAAKGLPLIVLPHGGPYDVRDHGDYDPDVQFLANRGYVVLQPQYRGSGAYGKAFDEKGSAQWGRAMQDDIDDGLDWLAKRGIVDPGRACIVGISYGGYAAIWGATRNPERWRCAVSLAGISDLPRQLKYQLNSFSNRKAREKWRLKVQGDAAFDLKTVSGLYAIDRLKVPVMLAHGDKDQTVPIVQSRAYAAALKAAGKTHEYFELAKEGHGISTASNGKIWYDRLDAFLARHNPAK